MKFIKTDATFRKIKIILLKDFQKKKKKQYSICMWIF